MKPRKTNERIASTINAALVVAACVGLFFAALALSPRDPVVRDGVWQSLTRFADSPQVSVFFSAFVWIGALYSTAATARRLHMRERKTPTSKKSGARGKIRRKTAILALFLSLVIILLASARRDARRFLRYKVYDEFFVQPLAIFIQSGKFSWKLLIYPVFIAALLGALIFFWRRKKKNASIVLLLIAGAAVASSRGVAAVETPRDAPTPRGERRLEMVQPPSIPENFDPRALAQTPTEENQDGHYNAHQAILKCFAVMKYAYDGGRWQNQDIFFRMRFPPREEPGKKYPLILWMHGYGESTGDNMRQLAHLHRAAPLFAGPDALDFYMIAVQLQPDNPVWNHSVSERGAGDSGIAVLNEIMERACEEFPIDVDRISVMGLSSGASAAWEFVARSKRKISAMAVFSGIPPQRRSPETYEDVAIWAFNNRFDGPEGCESVEKYVKAINKIGGDARLTIVDSHAHDSWSEPLKQGDVLRWALDPASFEGKTASDAKERSFAAAFFMWILPASIILCNLLFTVKVKRHEEG